MSESMTFTISEFIGLVTPGEGEQRNKTKSEAKLNLILSLDSNSKGGTRLQSGIVQ